MKKLLSLFLVIAVVFSVSTSTILINADEDSENATNQGLSGEQTSVSEQLEQLAQEYTDRFIIKYNGDIEEAVGYACDESNKVKQQELETIKGSNEEEFLKISENDEEIVVSKNVRDLISKENTGDISTFSDEPVYEIDQEKSVIKLSKKVDPEIFTEKIYEKASGRIEYIQPDYKLELSDIDEGSKDKAEEDKNIDSKDSDKTLLEDERNKEDIQKENKETEDISVDLEVIENQAETSETESPVPETTETSEPENVESENVESETENIESETEENEEIDTESYDDLQNDIQSGWRVTKGTGVKVAVIDSKVDITHQDLSSHVVNGFNIVNNTELTYEENQIGQYYHGTHVTGIISSTVPEAEIIPIAAFENGQAYTSDLIKAIEYAKEHGATIVNCSWGSTDNNQALKEAMENSGLLFVCAAGNSRINVDETPIYPASFDIENVISVTSLNEDMGFSYYSNYGNSVDIAMYGRNVRSTLPGGEYGEQSGTSMSAAYVTAGAAMAESNGVQNIKESLLNTAVKLSNLKDKVNSQRKLSYSNLVNNIISDGIIEISPKDDFDVNGYQRTPEENWELFSSLKTVQVEAGGNNTAFIKSDGSLWMAGDNTYGQLGNGTYENSAVPVQVIGLTDIVQVAVGERHCIALNSRGYAYLWGYNGYNAVSFSDNRKISLPVMHTLSNITYVEAGSLTSFVVQGFNGIYAQGDNSYGQLGNGTKDTLAILTHMENSNGADIVKSYNKHTFFINVVTVFACGANDHNVLGLSYAGTTLTPEPVSISIDIDTGYNHAVAIDETGMITAWETNDWGQCGKGIDGKGYIDIYNAKDVKCGKEHSIVLLEDGTVMTWGYNLRGQIGDGTHNKRYEPYAVKGMTNITQIAAGNNHIVALDANGNVWRWGDNSYGQFGNGSTVSSNSPINNYYGDLEHKNISSGSNHILYVDKDGKLFTKGDNTYGQLGTSDNVSREDFAEVHGPWGSKKIVKAETCADTSFVLTEDNKVYGWGRNDKYQLHDNTNIDKNVPILIAIAVIDVAAGLEHVIALSKNGEVMAWGENTYGQIILDTISGSSYTRLFSNAKKIAAGDYQSYIIDENSNLYALGKNDKGQLGTSDTENKSQPAFVMNNVKDVSCGNNHTAILTNSGKLFVCGDNTYDQLGITLPNSATYTSSPTDTMLFAGEIFAGANSTAYMADGKVYQCGSVADTQNKSYQAVEGLSDITEVDIGETCLAANADGELYRWGNMAAGKSLKNNITVSPVEVDYPYAVKQVDSYRTQTLAINELGQVIAWGEGYYANGSDKMETKTYPTVIEGIENPTQVSRGKNHNLVLDKNGDVWCWGSNTNNPMGTLGGKVKKASKMTGISNVKQIAAGTEFSIFLKNDGTIWGVGKNDKGQIGQGNTDDYLTPTQITSMKTFKKVSAGESFVVALAEDGLYSWGANTDGQIGNGTTDDEYIPVKLNAELENGEYFTDISAGTNFCLGLTNFGNVYSWGNNGSGRLGLGDKNNRNIPTKIKGITGIKNISAGDSSSLAVKNDGTVYGWGYGSDGQLGFFVTGSTLNPKEITTLNGKNIKQTSCGRAFSVAIGRDGKLYSFGRNNSGQLGIYSSIPVKVTSNMINDTKWLNGYMAQYLSPIAVSMVLPSSAPNGSKIVWKSSNTDYILDDGTFIKRPDRCSDDIEINLSAEISDNTELFSTCFSYIIEKDSSLSTDVYISAKKGDISSFVISNDENNNMLYTITFDSDIFEIVDLIGITDEQDILPGCQNGTIKIESVDKGVITFRYSATNNFNGYINCLKFKAAKDGNTEIKITNIIE